MVKNKMVKAYFVPKNKIIEVEFSKIFKKSIDARETDSVYDKFHMQVGSKRIYAKMSDVICDSNNIILSKDDAIRQEVLYNYFCIKKAIDDRIFITKDNQDAVLINTKTTEKFIGYLINLLFTPKFIKIIKDYVDENYSDEISVDANLIAGKDYNEGTTFTDKHFKILYTVTCMSRFVLPLCMHYIYVCDDSSNRKDDFIFSVLKALVRLAESDSSSDLMNKLRHRIFRDIRKTSYAHNSMWERIKMFNKTKESVNNELVVKIINTAVPKFSFDKMIINFIKVISRETIEEYTLRAKDKFKATPIISPNETGDDEDSLSENDVFDLHYTKQDETDRLFKKYANDSTIEIICRTNNLFISEDEWSFYNKTLEINGIQNFLVSQAFSSKFRGIENVKSCSREQYNKLVIILAKKMELLGLDNLKYYVTGIRISHSQIRKPSTVLMNSLYSDPVFIDLCNTKYRFVKNVFDKKGNGVKDDKNPIKDNLLKIINNDYVYNHYQFINNGKMIDIKDTIIKDELLKFYKLMIC